MRCFDRNIIQDVMVKFVEKKKYKICLKKYRGSAELENHITMAYMTPLTLLHDFISRYT